jgi:hypothetical protein
MSRTFSTKNRSVESLKLRVRCGCSKGLKHARHGRFAEACPAAGLRDSVRREDWLKRLPWQRDVTAAPGLLNAGLFVRQTVLLALLPPPRRLVDGELIESRGDWSNGRSLAGTSLAAETGAT